MKPFHGKKVPPIGVYEIGKAKKTTREELTEELEYATQQYRAAERKFNEAHDHLLEVERKFEMMIEKEEIEVENTYN